MQASAAGLQRMHAAGIVSPLRVSSSAWSTTRRLAANRGVRTGLHTVQAAEQRASGSEPSSVDIKGNLLFTSSFAKNSGTIRVKKALCESMHLHGLFRVAFYITRYVFVSVYLALLSAFAKV